MKIIASLIFVLFLASATSAYGQVWREIKPIESTGEDVRRLLGDKVNCWLGRCEYKLPKGGTVYFEFSLGTCKDKPAGAVTEIMVFPGPAYNLFISDLNIDESKLIPGDPGDQLNIDVYESRELGIKIEAGKDKRVVTLKYFPAAKYDTILCSPASEAKPKPPVVRK